jgi:hypothetical protein
MKKLIHVVRGRADVGVAFSVFTAEGEPLRLHEVPMVVNVKEIRHFESSYPPKEGEFFLVGERDVQTMLTELASVNPGCEVRVYGAELIAQCPPAEMVTKKISSHGVLPNI